MKKVLFTATVDSHILQFHLPFLKLFKDRGYEVHVATNGTEEIPYCDKKHIITFERSPYKLNNIKAVKQLKKIINEEKFDIIHCHTPMGGVITRLAAKQARKKYGTRVIYTAHGFHFCKGGPIKNWILYYPIEWYLAKYMDTLVTINNEDYELAKKKFSKRCKDINYVPGIGIDDEKFDIKVTEKEKKELRKELGLKETDFVMLYPAEVSMRKRHIWLINTVAPMLKEHKDMYLLLPGEDSLNGQAHQLVKKYGLEKQIQLLGYRKDIPKLLKISNLSISSSNREGLPVNLMEAMYSQIPMVVTDCRGNRDLVKDGENGFIIESNDSNRFVEAILELKNSIDLYKRMSMANKDLIKPYMLDKVMNCMQEIYFKKKSIVYLRSTAIYNDSRACKEIDSYSDLKNKVLVFGWNRKLEKIRFKNNSLVEYTLYNCKSSYGSGIKNIFKILGYNLWIYKQLSQNKDKYDIIHACDFDTAFIASYFAKKNNKRIIYDIYDYYVDCHNLGALKGIIEKKDIKIINNADYVLICTEKRKEQISKANPKKIAIIHNSPKVLSIESKKEKESPNKTRVTKVGYFGILQDDRLLIEITESIKDNKEIELIIGGFGKYEEYFKNISNKYENICYLGTLPYDQVIENEKNVDILFATYNPKIENHRYSAPNKVYEAMMLGKPIIVCKNTGIDEMVDEEKIGVSIDYDAKSFIDSIEYLQKNPINNSIELFREKYSWNVMEKELEKIIEYLRR